MHNWHHAPIVRRTGELVRRGRGRPGHRVIWHTLRTRRRGQRRGDGENWRVDPAVAGGGVLTDHGWHVSYVVQRLDRAPPLAVERHLETRRHAGLAVEDTASVRVTFPDATAEILLTWAADARRNWAEVSGTAGVPRAARRYPGVASAAAGTTERWACPPALSDGLARIADWFEPVAAGFVGRVAGAAARRREPGGGDGVRFASRRGPRVQPRGGVDLPLAPAPALRPA